MSDSLRPHGLQPTRVLCPWDSPGKNTGVGCHFLLQGIFPTQGSNPGLLPCGQTLYHLSHQGSPIVQSKWFPCVSATKMTSWNFTIILIIFSFLTLISLFFLVYSVVLVHMLQMLPKKGSMKNTLFLRICNLKMLLF